MRTIAVVARKGGSGKTTVAVHMGIAAHNAARRTLIVDTDPQQSAVEVLKLRTSPGPQCYAATPSGLIKAQIEARMDGVDAMLIDTPAGTEEGMSNAVVLADLTLLIVRPTFLDLAAALQTADVVRRLRKPCLVILNQAPVARDGVEPPAVKKAQEALKLMRLPVAPVTLRARASYQTAFESGASAAELTPDSQGAREVGELWKFIERFAFAPIPARPPAPTPAAVRSMVGALAEAESVQMHGHG